MRRLGEALRAHGHPAVSTIDLRPRFGRAPIAHYAQQLDRHADALRRERGAERLDVVGFSMGALVARYWIQRGGGRPKVRRFVSLAGPHGGSLWAFLAPLPAVREMRPGSALLTDLERDRDPWGEVRVYSLWTPWDLMVVPGRSGQLSQGIAIRTAGVLTHPGMVRSPVVVDAVLRALAEREPERSGREHGGNAPTSACEPQGARRR